MKRNTKKSQQKQKKFLLNQQRALFGALILLIAAGAVYVLGGWAYQSFYVEPREAKVAAVINGLQLDDSLYILQDQDGTSFEYLRGAAVADTTRELNEKITAAGASEVVAIEVVSKPYFDYKINRSVMGESLQGLSQLDPNEGPSMVTIKVNLDDNNE